MIDIRQATKFDLPKMVGLVKNYSFAMEHPLATEVFDEETARSLFTEILAGRGLALVATYNEVVQGIAIGYITNNIWNAAYRMLHEIVFWVEPDYRGTRMAHLLLKEYIAKARELKATGRVHECFISNMEKSRIDYGRYGCKKFQEEWVV